MPIRYSNVVGGSSGGTGFNLDVGSSGNNTFTFSEPQPAGGYSITSQLTDATIEFYAIAEDGTLAGYTNTKALNASKDFDTLVVYGAATNDLITFEFKETTLPTSIGQEGSGAAPYMVSVSEADLGNLDDTTIITGGNFATDVTVTFTGTDNVSLNAKSIVRNSSTELIVTRPDTFLEDNSPYTMTVINPSIPEAQYVSNSIQITAGGDPVWSSELPPDATLGASYAFTLNATDPDGGNISYSLASGTALPQGMSLSNNQILSGQIQEGGSFIISATDPGGNVTNKSFTIGIAPSLTSFGIQSGQSKATSYESYTGENPSGQSLQQYTKMTSNATGRTGGLTYTDLLLEEDFFICFYSSHGSDFYNAVFLYDESYNVFTHSNLGNQGITDYGYAARYGAYVSTNGLVDIWDGPEQPEGDSGNAGRYGPVTGSTGYIGLRRSGGKFYTYYSTSAPGPSGFENMTLMHGPSTTTFNGRVRVGIFAHDSGDFLEVYTPGTTMKALASGYYINHPKSNWTLASSTTGNRSLASGSYFASDTNASYKFAVSSSDARPSNIFVDGPITDQLFARGSGSGNQTDSVEFYFANRLVTPSNITLYTYPQTDYTLKNANLSYWNGSTWIIVAGLGTYASSTLTNWQVTVPGLHSNDSYTPATNAASFTFNGTPAEAEAHKSKTWRIFLGPDVLQGTDDVYHINGAGPLNFWDFGPAN